MSLLARLEEAFVQHATRPAVEGQRWLLSFRDLDHESARLAAALQQRGLGRGHVVPMSMARSPAFVVAMLAVVRCSAAYAPIDPGCPPARQATMLAALHGPMVLRSGADGFDAAVDPLRRTVLSVDALLRDAPVGARPPWPDLSGDAPLYAMFTSGSTGVPKAVLVPHRAVERLVCGADYADFRPGARWAQMSSLAFDASTLELWGPLLNGGCCVVLETPHPSLDELAHFLQRHRITDAWLTSALFNALVDDHVQALGGLQQLLTGGERVSPAHVRACLSAWPRLRLTNGYGPTENTTFSLCHTVGAADLAEDETQVPIGRPIRGTVARVAAPSGHELPAGQVGELWVAGDGLAIGYLNDTALTAERFVEHDGRRWYRTGDQVRRRVDGVHEFLGRADRQVKIAGHRIELDEVERTLAACPGVGEAAVLVLGDSAQTLHLVGLYCGRGAPAPAEPEVRDALAAWLPAHAVPGRIHRLERLPLNVNGKVDRQALLAWVKQSGGPATAAVVPDEAGLHTEAQRRVADIWLRCLPPMQASPGPQAHFMRCGGTSLLALRVASELARSFGRRIDPLALLLNPLLADQARLLETAPLDVPPAPAPARGLQAVPLSRSAQLLVRASAVDAGGAAYLVHVALQIEPVIRPDALRAAFGALAQRHPMLRTAVRLQGDAAQSWLLDELPRGWWVQHAQAVELPIDGTWPRSLTPVVTRPLDLAARGPMRVDFWPQASGGHLCVWTLHHFAIDEAGIDQALADLDGLMAGRPLAPVLGSPFAFAALESGRIDEPGLQEQATEIARVLCAQMPPLPPPPRAGGELDLPLPHTLQEALDAFCRGWQCTPFTPLVVAAALAQQQLFGPAWRFLATPFSRRSEPDLIEPVGYLLDLRLVEAGALPGEDLQATLARVHGLLLQAQQLRFRPLDRLAAAVGNIDTGAAAGLTQFAITWRALPLRPRPMGGATARLLHVPLTGARFGLAVHVYSTPEGLRSRVEAVREAIDDGRAAAFGIAFVQQLQRVLECATQAPAIAPPHPRTADPDDRRCDLARRAWARWLGDLPESDDANFLRAGGSSLLAMRLAATLRREAGLALDVGAFLAKPSFGSLCQLLTDRSDTDTEFVTLIGPHRAERVWLLLPGMLVGALGMFALAAELQAKLPDDCAVAVVDTDAIMRRAPDGRCSAYFDQQLEQAVRDVGDERIAGVLGYSVGGVLGIRLLNRMGPAWAAKVPLWMLDTYAPQHTRQSRATKARRALVSLVRHPGFAPRLIDRRRRGLAPTTPAVPGGPQDLKALWHVFLAELADAELQTAGIDAMLIHSSGAAKGAGVWRHSASNGFDPSRFASLGLVPIDCDHYDLRSVAAPRVAEIVTTARRAGLRISA